LPQIRPEAYISAGSSKNSGAAFQPAVGHEIVQPQQEFRKSWIWLRFTESEIHRLQQPDLEKSW
jgi:hypothetical protein